MMGSIPSLKRQLTGHLWDIRVVICAIVSILVSTISPAAGASLPDHKFSLEFETGAVWQSRNQIHIPDSSAGTRFALTGPRLELPTIR